VRHADTGGNDAPNTALYSLDGQRFILYSILEELPEGGVAIINFTSARCKPCTKEIPELLSLCKSSPRARLICVYAEPARQAAASASSLGVYDLAFADPLGTVQHIFRVTKYPVTLVITKTRQIAGRFEGYNKANITAISDLIAR